MNKKIIAVVLTALLATTSFAHGHYRGWHGGWGHSHHYHHHHCGWWGHGGRNFIPGFVGGVVGGAIIGAATRYYYNEPTVVVSQPSTVVVPQPQVVVQQPTVVQQPVVTTAPATSVIQTQYSTTVVAPQQVWVPGRYVNQVQANGTVVRVWQPGHYEYQ